MSIESMLKRKLARMELKDEFVRALYPYLDDPSYSVGKDGGESHYTDEQRRMMEGHESLMCASGKYRSAFQAFKDASDRGAAKLNEIESQVPDAEKQRQPFRFMFLATAAFAVTNLRTIIRANRNLNKMFDMYERENSPVQPTQS
jgi:hypothetical protein